MKYAEGLYAGLVGEVVSTFDPYTEGDPLAVAGQFLVAFGSAVGPTPHVVVGETVHHANENLLIVGSTAHARKGDSRNIALRPFRDADPDWFHGCIASGLSSGEGLIYCVRDAATKTNAKGESVVSDEGVPDKRLCVVESEFAGPLKVMSREGNTLSPLLRDAWDAKPTLRTLTRNSPLRATGPHVSIIGHATPADLLVYLSSVEMANGFANRFGLLSVKRSKVLPNPGRARTDEVARISDSVGEALRRARQITELRRTREGDLMWGRLYPKLTAERPGILSQLLTRAEAHALRFSMIYALMDGSNVIDTPHLLSAMDLWDRVEASTKEIFAAVSGNPTADRIREGLVPGEPMTLADINDTICARNISAGVLRRALELLRDSGVITITKDKPDGRGRPTTWVTLVSEVGVRKNEENEISPQLPC